MGVKSDLAQFYSKNAAHYHQTRQKFWVDWDKIIEQIRSLKLEKVKVLELGCGSWRFLDYLKKHYKGDVDYVGIDIAEGMLDFARKEHPEAKFIAGDMSQILTSFERENFDVIVACASFQHLPQVQERQRLIDMCYRLLRYEGLLMMTNWAFSKWFLKKHWRIFVKSGFKFLISLGKQSWRDVFVPRVGKDSLELRYYHLFSLEELRLLLTNGGFRIKKLSYVDRRGEEVSSWKNSNNSRFVAVKTIFR